MSEAVAVVAAEFVAEVEEEREGSESPDPTRSQESAWPSTASPPSSGGSPCPFPSAAGVGTGFGRPPLGVDSTTAEEDALKKCKVIECKKINR